jgi:riboflavin synthase
VFTGIVEEIGSIKSLSQKGQAMILTIQAKRILEDVHLGDSISVNGVCLTVTDYSASQFSLDVMPETFRKTNLHELSNGSKVNLERAMQANGRFGGHIVQGHVDGIGMVRQRTTEENAVVFTIEPKDSSMFRYMIDQGSITIDGISLTIVKAAEGSFSVSIIPHTLAQTILQDKRIGDTVNIECDLLGKYVNHLLRFDGNLALNKKSILNEAFLSENGFM